MTNVDYTFGNRVVQDDDEAASGDKREDYRLSGRASVTLELESGLPEESGEPSAETRRLICRIRDLSARGLCLVVPEAVTPGALLPAEVALGDGPEEFALTVEIKWCRADERGHWLVGVEIQNSDDTSYLDWVEAIARVMTED
ncbi:MAG: PilZ domain-containing protein [Pseudomonadota bacterium]